MLIVGVVAGVVILVSNFNLPLGGFVTFLTVLLSSVFSFIVLLGFSEIIFLLNKKQTQHYEEIERITEKKPVKKPDNTD